MVTAYGGMAIEKDWLLLIRSSSVFTSHIARFAQLHSYFGDPLDVGVNREVAEALERF